MNQKEIVIIDGARTAFGAFGGSLATQTATDLAVYATRGAIERSGVDPQLVDQVVVGNVIHSAKETIYIGRHVALRSGLQMETPGLSLNLLCGSGVYAVAQAGMLINSDQASMAAVVGTDALSMTPYLSWSTRWGQRMGHAELFDGLDIRDTLPNASMGETAENLQAKFNIAREAQDEFACLSQSRFKKATDAGRWSQEIVPITLTDKKGKATVIDKDEHARETNMESLAKLRPVFKKDGSVTAGNACGIVDGAAAVMVTSLDYAEKLNLKPMCRVVSWAVTGVPPEIMGIGPVYAIPLALRRAKLTLDDIDLIEINEAFAVQYLACEKELGLDRNKVNVNGGAIAVGHPFGASGTRLLLTIGKELQARKLRYGLVSLCVGSGMGIAMVVERI